MIISVLNHKGGVGKTTTVHNLGAALANAGKTVLIADFDPQCNLTCHCTREKLINGIGYAVLNKSKAQNLLIGIKENLWLIPGSEFLDEIAMQWGHKPDLHTLHLHDVLKPISNNYDYILVDTAPGSSMLMINAIFTADSLIIPICDVDSIQGARKITRLLQRHKISISGHYLITRHDQRTLLSREMYSVLTQKNKDAVFQTCIRATESIRQAAARKTDVISFSPNSNGAKDYINLAGEILSTNII